MSKGNIIILGGDGFCGWPTSLHLSNLGYSVTIIDNLVRRDIDNEKAITSITPIESIEGRCAAWNELTHKSIEHVYLDIARDYLNLCEEMKRIKPMAIVHFAEQRSAPYSMRSSRHKAYTIENNIRTTHNLLNALVETKTDAHVVHLGTMGVYGYGTAGISIPEGYIKCLMVDPITHTLNQQPVEIYYPPNPGSIYHMTKVLDAQLFAFYQKNDGLRITDLHQGIVWGIDTDLTSSDPRLVNRFDYDGDFGTVLNRWIAQSAVGHPLTVYGTGGQTRAFVHIQNTVQCIQLAVENPPAKNGRVKVWNQTTEQLNILDIAKQIKNLTGAKIRHYNNPRVEAAENSLSACMENIHTLGLKPIKLNNESLQQIIDLAYTHKNRINQSKIICTSTWRDSMPIDYDGVLHESTK